MVALKKKYRTFDQERIIMKRILCLLASVVTLAAATSYADVVNIDVGGAPNLYTGLAAAPDAEGVTAVWNGVGTATSSGLQDSSGTTTGVGLTLTGGGVFFNPTDQETAADPNGDGSTLLNLLGDYAGLRAGDNGADLRVNTIDGLVAGNAYDLYFYGQGDNFTDTNNNGGQNTGFRIGTDVRHTSYDGTSGGDGQLVENVEYVLFTGIVADASGTITFEQFNPGTGVNGTDASFFDSDTSSTDLDGNASRFHALNGIQIVGDFTAVPEPSSLAVILGLGFAGLIRRKRS